MISNLTVRDSDLVTRLAGFVMLFVFFSTLPYCMAESSVKSLSSPIVVETDKDMYERGETMVISGEVRKIVNAIPLTIQIIDPNQNVVHVDQILVAQDGRFSLTVPVEGPLWKVPGNYTLMVQYGFKHILATTQFQFEEFEMPVTGAFNVKDKPSGQNFDLNYTITGGMVKSMYLEPQDLALIVELDTKNQGMIHLQIPRLLLDAKKSSNVDESFIVLVNDDEISSAHEGTYDPNYRVIDIPITNDDSKIEVIGTAVIPEFPFTIIALIIATFSIVVISRIKNIAFEN
ncbi:MAG: PEFG-CTERM sorting domain-containing protein [Candidatus Nitrosotalea sp.]|nr:PEFG-CTERM sorting domain-containing protein [Candidatus Nitrosotalea sp.]